MTRALIIQNIPTPYRIPLFNELARQCTEAGIALKLVFAAEGYGRRKWQVDLQDCRFDHEILGARERKLGRGAESASFSYPGLYALLRRERPDAIVVIGYSMATMKLWLRSWFRRTPYLIWSGTIGNQPDATSRLRRLQRRILVSRAAGFVAYGTKAREYLLGLGASPESIHVAINTVDTEYFRTEVARIGRRADSREFLYVGNLTAGKRLDLLLRAFAKLEPVRRDATLTLVGAGPMQATLVRLATELGIAANVRFEGFRQRADIAGYLARACCFVFPSEYDVWGLVLVEALAAGVPAIASIRSGATHDLVRDQVTGFAIDFEDVDAVTVRMAWVLDNPAAAARLGQAGLELIRDQVNLRVSAAGLLAAIRSVA